MSEYFRRDENIEQYLILAEVYREEWLTYKLGQFDAFMAKQSKGLFELDFETQREALNAGLFIDDWIFENKMPAARPKRL